VNWRELAACRNADPDVFFEPHSQKMERAAKALCASCDVRGDCLEAGMGEAHGIWGGLTSYERDRQRRGLPLNVTNPPPKYARRNGWFHRLSPLLEQPDEWVCVQELSTSEHAQRLASDLRHRVLHCPPGRWEFRTGTTRHPFFPYTVFARYLGPDTQTNTWVCSPVDAQCASAKVVA